MSGEDGRRRIFLMLLAVFLGGCAPRLLTKREVAKDIEGQTVTNIYIYCDGAWWQVGRWGGERP